MERGGENTNRKNILIALSVSIMIALLAAQTYGSVIGHAKLANAASGTTTAASTNGTISVEGNGQVSIQPDRGIVTVGVITQAATAEIAAQNNANSTNAVISALNGIGISSDDIQTTYYNIYAQETCCTGPPIVTGYQVNNQLQITITIASGQTVAQLGSEVGHAIDTAVANGANQAYGVEFTASSNALQEAQNTALRQAAQDASQKAHIIASALGLTITGVVSVTSTPTYPQPVFFGLTATTVDATPIDPPQTLTATATVQATFSAS